MDRDQRELESQVPVRKRQRELELHISVSEEARERRSVTRILVGGNTGPGKVRPELQKTGQAGEV